MSHAPSSRAARVVAAAALVPALALVTAFAAPDDRRADAQVVTITATDYAFVGPDTVHAGLTTVKLLNRGSELHHVQLLHLADGKTLKDFFTAMQAGGPPPKWAHDVGGPNTPVPGGESAATLHLAPGRYAMICFIPSPDGKPHVMKGMAKEWIVVAPKAKGASTTKVVQAGAAAPAVTMTLADYSFTLSTPLKAGRTTLRVRNAAAQPHEVLVVRLAPGKTAHDVFAWTEKPVGPPPGQPLGGTTGIATGGWNDITLDLTPGEYALLCFIPDAKDGKPHAVHGMTTQFSVK